MLLHLNYSVSYVYPFPRCGGTAVCWNRRLCSEEEAKLFSSTKQRPHRCSLCSTHHIAILSVAFCNLFGFSSAPQNTLRTDNYQSHFFPLTVQSITCHGSLVSGWRREPDTGLRWQTVAIWILVSLFPVILLWSYSLLGPGMDVPETSRHGKKSTSQKLEDQKKVWMLFFHILLDPDPNPWPILLFIFNLVCSSC